MFEKRMNRLGQEGMTLTTLLLIIVGVVVAAVIILGATGILKDVFKFGDIIPGELETVAQSCKLSAEAKLVTEYCYTFKKISDTEYINCQDARIKSSLSEQEVSVSFSCDEEIVIDARNVVCEGVSESKKADTSVGVYPEKCDVSIDYS